MKRNNLFLLLLFFICASCNASHLDNETVSKIKEVSIQDKKENTSTDVDADSKENKMEIAIIGGGCFWCTEAQYLALEGVKTVVSGYAGGAGANPSYKEVCSGTTGHAEVIKIEYDASVISYEEILQAFFVAHDPTQLNRQGADVGTQYRSTIMPLNDSQQQIATAIIKEFNDKEVFSHPVVTVIEPNQTFYPAEDYHQNYYDKNGGTNPYCTRVVGPKLKKFKKVFKDKLKKK
jgi:methionine-S-sulfoxide reductase